MYCAHIYASLRTFKKGIYVLSWELHVMIYNLFLRSSKHFKVCVWEFHENVSL